MLFGQDLGPYLLTGDRYSKVVVNTGLTVVLTVRLSLSHNDL